MSYERMSYERMSEFPALISAERFCKDILRYFCQKPLTYYDINPSCTSRLNLYDDIEEFIVKLFSVQFSSGFF